MKTAFLTLLSVCVSPAAANAASILTNGSFEAGNPPSSWTPAGIGTLGVNRFFTQSTAAGTFNVGAASMALGAIPDDFNAGNGGPGTGPATSEAMQTTTAGSVTPGSNFTFSFSMKREAGSYNVGTEYQFRLEYLDAGNATISDTGFSNVVGINETTFTNFSMVYVSPVGSSAARVTFKLNAGANNNPGNTPAGLFVDNVVLDAVPEPSVSAAFLLGVVFLANRRRR